MVPDRVRDSSWGDGLFTKPLNAIGSQAISVWQDSYKSPSWEELLQPLLPEYHAWASLMVFLTVRLHYSDLWSVPLQSRGHSLIIHVTHMADCPGPGTELEPTDAPWMDVNETEGSPCVQRWPTGRDWNGLGSDSSFTLPTHCPNTTSGVTSTPGRYNRSLQSEK